MCAPSVNHSGNAVPEFV